MMILKWTKSGFRFVEVFDGKGGSGYQPVDRGKGKSSPPKER